MRFLKLQYVKNFENLGVYCDRLLIFSTAGFLFFCSKRLLFKQKTTLTQTPFCHPMCRKVQQLVPGEGWQVKVILSTPASSICFKIVCWASFHSLFLCASWCARNSAVEIQKEGELCVCPSAHSLKRPPEVTYPTINRNQQTTTQMIRKFLYHTTVFGTFVTADCSVLYCM